MANSTLTPPDPRAPMSAAPLQYQSDGSVAWGTMWETFCVLAQAGGPPHRGARLAAPEAPDFAGEAYALAAAEIARGIHEVSGLAAAAGEPGWVAVICASSGMARWLASAIESENVDARAAGRELWVPVDGSFRLAVEIKSVITVVAKTTHYWREHVPPEIKKTLAAEAQLDEIMARLRRWWPRRRTAGTQPRPQASPGHGR